MSLSGVAPSADHAVYLPSVSTSYTWVSPFAVEVGHGPVSPELADLSAELGVGWMRLHRLHWRDVQPTEESDYDWSALSGFESELQRLAAAGIQPMVIVHHSPRWATLHESSCSAVRSLYSSFNRVIQACTPA